MERWGFYLSGILYGVCEVEGDQVFHRPLDVSTGTLGEKQELTKENTLYQKLGEMDVRDILLHMEEYDAAVSEGKEEFTTSFGARYTKKDNVGYVQRDIKFAKDLIVEDGKVIAVVTSARDYCSLFVKLGFEDRTILKEWETINQESIYCVSDCVEYMVPMRDGVRLATDVYLPKKEGKVPTILVRTPYGKRENKMNYYRFVQRGYAVVLQDVRGREDSEGEWLPNYHEVEDGDDTLNWIAKQSWSDGSVGMTGGSYLGYVQWAAAASGNPHLKAMLSSVCAGSAFVDLPRRGGCFSSGMLAWAFMISGQRSNPALMDRDDWEEVLDIRPLEDLAPKALGYDVPFLNTWFSHMDYDEMWKMSNWSERTTETKVPALIMSGWFDDNGMGTTEALDLYRDFKEKKVILGPWKHSGNAQYDIHGFELGNNALRYDMDLVCFSWIDHYLKGVDNGIEKTPVVEYYTMGSNEWRTAENWPVPNTKELVLYLDHAEGEGRLSFYAPEKEEKDSYVYDPKNPSTHIIDMSENELEVPEDYTEEEKREDVLCYSTETLTEDLTITGDAKAVIYISSDCEDTDLVVRVTDVDENGRSMKLSDGVISVKYRNQFEKPEYMEPGNVYEVGIRTTKLSHTFKKGHKLRVTITSSAKNFIFPNRNTREGFNSVEIKIANNSIHRGCDHASKVVFRQEI